MDRSVVVEGLSKRFKVPQREAGVRASLGSVFRRRYTDVDAVEDLTFGIDRGEVVGFLGPNGAGKTTTLKMLAGLLAPSGGSARVLGFEPFRREREYLRRISLVMGNRNQLQWDLPALDSFELHRVVYRIPTVQFTRTRDELIDLLDLGGLVNKPVRSLSLGERMRAEIADCLLHQPQVLFLDEPTLGLDVTMQRRIRAFLAGYNARNEASVLLTSHYMADVEALCKRVIVIHHGRLLFDGGLAELAAQFGTQKTIRVHLADDRPDAVAKALESCRADGLDVDADEVDEGVATFRVERAQAPRLAALLLRDLDVADVSIEDPPIEDIIDQVFANG
jgi:ABC-2 type transport system ATP-binding protein